MPSQRHNLPLFQLTETMPSSARESPGSQSPRLCSSDIPLPQSPSWKPARFVPVRQGVMEGKWLRMQARSTCISPILMGPN